MAKSKLMKNVNSFTAKKDYRPVLMGVHFASNGDLYATDSHILVRVEGINKTGASFTLNLDSLEQIDSEYPNAERLIMDSSGSTVIKLDETSSKALFTFSKQVKKTEIAVTISGDSLELSAEGVKTRVPVETSGESETIYLFGDYLHTVLQLFIDEKLTDITVDIYGKLRPLKFTAGNITSLITPIRK